MKTIFTQSLYRYTVHVFKYIHNKKVKHDTLPIRNKLISKFKLTARKIPARQRRLGKHRAGKGTHSYCLRGCVACGSPPTARNEIIKLFRISFTLNSVQLTRTDSLADNLHNYANTLARYFLLSR